jgi:hypothetical protein
MENSRNAFARFFNRIKVSDVALNELVVTFRLHWLNVKQPESEMFPQKRHNLRSNPTARTSDQNPFPHANTSVQLKLWQQRCQIDRTQLNPCGADAFWKRIIFLAARDCEFSQKGMKGIEPKVMA